MCILKQENSPRPGLLQTRVVNGGHDRRKNTPFQKTFRVKRLVYHHHYFRRHLRYDVALLQLTASVRISKGVQIVALPRQGSRIAPGRICYVTGGQSGPCRGYRMLSSRDRSQLVPRGNVLKCDRRTEIINGQWYRFSGAAGTRMPTSKVPINRCGTHAPGWMVGPHPSSAQGIVNRKVCFHFFGRPCQWSQNIQVRNCGAFYVYRLYKTPTCWLRYCGNGRGK
ncbi:hypothetical protein QZH41_016134 [Actinostola sp. cb2023]|nr:hypothetical protein QZH41_016134 [Actinostola sp. cb2023]